MSHRQLFAFLFCISLSGACHASNAAADDARAMHLLQQAGRFEPMPARKVQAGPATSADARKLLTEITRTLILAEHGMIRVTPILVRRLEHAEKELQRLDDQVRTATKAPAGSSLICGTVRVAGSGAPIDGASVVLYDFVTGNFSTSTLTNGSGGYCALPPPGHFIVQTSATGYVKQAYNGVPCNDSFFCPRYAGDVVSVGPAGVVNGIDFALPVAPAAPGVGSIAGTVTRSADDTAIAGMQVDAVPESTGTYQAALTDTNGVFVLSGLTPGRYRVLSRNNGTSGLLAEAYANRPCSNDQYDCESIPVDWVTVSAGTTANGINLSLDPTTSISGVVIDQASGLGIANAEISLLSNDRWTAGYFSTNAAGAFQLTQVRPGDYGILARSASYDPITGQSLPSTHVPVELPGTPVSVSAPGAVVSGVDFTLSRGGTIQGRVLKAGTSVPIVGAPVSAINAAGLYLGSGQTDVNGDYSMAGIRAGVYFVVVDPRRITTPDSSGYQRTWNGDIACGPFTCSSVGVPVTVGGTGSVVTANINAAPGGSISGTITDGRFGVPATSFRTRIELFDSMGRIADQQTANYDAVSGTTKYLVTGLSPGAYKGVFASSTVIGYVDTAYGGVPCPRGGCDLGTLPTIFATSGGTLVGVNGVLPRGQVIRGRIFDAATGSRYFPPAWDPDFYAYIPQVAFYNSLDNYAGFGSSNTDGNYVSRTGFAPGTTLYVSSYFKRNDYGFGDDYIDQNFSGVPCPHLNCGATTGTGITIGAADVNGIDFAMSKGAAIGGTVTAASGGAPIAGVRLNVYNGAGVLSGTARTDSIGAFRVRGLSAGSYFVTTANALGYLDKVYPSGACEPFCNPLTGSPVAVAGTATTAGINFALDLAATVSGTVSNGPPVANVPVEIYGAIGNLLRSTTSGAGGSYAFTGLSPGTYYVRTRNTTGQADELWSGEPCVGDACNVRRGTPVALSAGATANNRNLTLAAPGVITGQVTGPSGAQSGVSIQLLAATGAVAMTTSTNGAGNYSFSGLAAGNYRVVTRGTPGLIDVSYPGVPCPAACNGLNGSPIAVTAGATSSGNGLALQAAGYISGTVRSGPAAPVVGAIVQAYSTTNVPTAQIATNASGNYQIDGLPTGQFYVRTQNSQGLIDQVFRAPSNLSCSGFCDVLSGTQVAVNAGSAIPLPDFTLAGGAIISGRVTNAATGNGIALATVLAYDRGGNVAGVATANATGNYTIGGLRLLESTGSAAAYRLRTANLSGFVNQLYRGSGNISCSPTPCSNLFLGTAIAASGTPVAGINFALQPGSVISGTATDQFNNPLPTGTAVLYDSTAAQITTTPIDRGLWQFTGLANGTYYVLIQNNVGLVDQLYANVACPGGACNIVALGTPIVLSGGAGGGAVPKGAVVAKGGVATIDLKLNTGQTIAGTVREQGTNTPLAGVTVYFFNAAGVQVGEAVTDGLGEYLSNGSFQANTYYAATANGTTRGAGETLQGVGYVNRLYAGQNCLLACNVASGTPINVSAAPVQNIDFNLATAGAGITGTVRDAGNQTLEQIVVEIYGADGRLAGTTLTNAFGVYAIDGLPAGNYYARTRNNVGLTDRLFGGQACAGNCNPLNGTVIAVPAVNAINGIDITLALTDPIFGNGFE